MTCKSEDCDGTKYTGAFRSCQACGVVHWWDESRLRWYGSRALGVSGTSNFHETGWAVCHDGHPDSLRGVGPTKATALADLRQRVRLAEGLDAAVGELRKLEKASGLDLSGWAPGVYVSEHCGCGQRYDDHSELRCQLAQRQAMRAEAYGHHDLDPHLPHHAIVKGLTTFMQWVGEPVERVGGDRFRGVRGSNCRACDYVLMFGGTCVNHDFKSVDRKKRRLRS